MPNHLVPASVALAFLVATSVPVSAQSLSDRIARVQRERQAEAAQNQAENRSTRITRAIVVDRNDPRFTDMTAREAFAWLAETADLPIIVPWDKLQEQGVDPDTKMQFVTQRITVAAMLDLFVRQISDDVVTVLWEPTRHYVEVMTKEQANARSVIMLYPIGDLLFEAPNFTNAPRFDLNQIGQQGGSTGGGGFGGGNSGGGFGGGGNFGGGGGGGGGGGLFNDSGEDEVELPTKEERADRIAQLIRDTIEPDLWRENGGEHGSIKFIKDNLIIRAPMYVHRQIGGGASIESPSPGSTPSGGRKTSGRYVTFDASLGDSRVTGIGSPGGTTGSGFVPQTGVVNSGSSMQIRGRIVGVEKPRLHNK